MTPTLRIQVDANGVQYVAMPSGARLPYVGATRVEQDVDEARQRIARVRFDMYVNMEGHIRLGSPAAETNGVDTIEFNGETCRVTRIRETITNDDPILVEVYAICTLDQTVSHAVNA